MKLKKKLLDKKGENKKEGVEVEELNNVKDSGCVHGMKHMKVCCHVARNTRECFQ